MTLDSVILPSLAFALSVAGAIWAGGLMVGRWRASLEAATTQIVSVGQAAAHAIEQAEDRCAKRGEMLQREIERVSSSVSRAHERIDVHVGDIGAHTRRNGSSS